MLKITHGSEKATLRLEGQVAGPWVDELRRAYTEASQLNRPFTLDLKNVTFIDAAGVAFFEQIATEVTLINCSLFAAEQLKSVLTRQQAVR
jgi:anti-anti-sigma regulatory factor